MSKTIEIKKVHIRNLFLSFIVGFGILFGLEHFGTFRYEHSYTQNSNGKPAFEYQVPATTPVSKIKYETYFGDEIQTDGNGFDLYDLNYKETEFNRYSTKSYYYTQATIKDFKYGIYISIALFFITLLFTAFKIKII